MISIDFLESHNFRSNGTLLPNEAASALVQCPSQLVEVAELQAGLLVPWDTDGWEHNTEVMMEWMMEVMMMMMMMMVGVYNSQLGLEIRDRR